MKTTILFHIYYPGTIKETSALLKLIENNDTNFIFNVPYQPYNVHRSITDEIQSIFPKALILNTSNKGKDIGGKLAMLNCYLKSSEKSDYLIFLHDKKSELKYTINNHKIDSDLWKKELFSIIHQDNISLVKNLLAENETGMVTHANHIYTMEEHGKYVIFGNNMLNIEELCRQFNLTNIAEKKTDFSGGTMFWVKSSIYEEFFTENSPLEIRAMLEEGMFTDRYTGTYSHAMERIFSWIITSKGFKIRGI